MERQKGSFVFAGGKIKIFGGSATATVLKAGREEDVSLKEALWVSCLSGLPGIKIGASFRNRDSTAVSLRRFNLVEGEMVLKGDLSQWRFFPIGTVGKRATLFSEKVLSRYETIRAVYRSFNAEPPTLPPHPRYEDPRWRESKDVAVITNQDGDTILIGAAGAPVAYVEVSLFIDGNSVKILVTSEMDDVVVEPGEERASQEVVFLSLPMLEAMEVWAKMVAESHGYRINRHPLVGWCSWYNEKQNRISEQDIVGIIEATKKEKDRLSFQVIQIDDGYQKTVGDWQTNERFPRGLSSLVKRIKEAGLMPGLWLAPLAVNDSLPLFYHHPDWFQRDQDGNLLDRSWTGWGGRSYALDPTHPEVQKYLRTIIQDAVLLGFEYLKLDFNELAEGVRFFNPKKTRLEAMRDLFRLYREAMGEKVYLLSGIGLERGALGFADAMRIGPDAVAEWDAPVPWCIRESIRAVLFTQPVHRVWWNNDPDVTYLKPYRKLTAQELKTWHSAVGLSCGTVMISELLGSKDYSRHFRNLEILTPPPSEKVRPFDLGKGEYPQCFGFRLLRPWEDSAVVMVWNPEKDWQRLVIDLERIGLSGSQNYHVWSFWDEAYLGVFKKSWSTPEIPFRDCLVVKITPADKDGTVPVLVGSTLHISCGAAEVANLLFFKDCLQIELTNSGARNGRLFLYAANRRPEIKEVCGCRTKGVEVVDANLYSLGIEERVRGKQQSLILKV